MAKQIDKHTETWQAVEAWARQYRSAAVADLIQGGVTPGYEDKLRGDIRTIDALLALAEGQEPLPHTAVTY